MGNGINARRKETPDGAVFVCPLCLLVPWRQAKKMNAHNCTSAESELSENHMSHTLLGLQDNDSPAAPSASTTSSSESASSRVSTHLNMQHLSSLPPSLCPATPVDSDKGPVFTVNLFDGDNVLRELSLVIDTCHNLVICRAHKKVLHAGDRSLRHHFRSEHDGSAELERHMGELKTLLDSHNINRTNRPTPPRHPVMPISGVAIQAGYHCCWCESASPSYDTLRKHPPEANKLVPNPEHKIDKGQVQHVFQHFWKITLLGVEDLATSGASLSDQTNGAVLIATNAMLNPPTGAVDEAGNKYVLFILNATVSLKWNAGILRTG